MPLCDVCMSRDDNAKRVSDAYSHVALSGLRVSLPSSASLLHPVSNVAVTFSLTRWLRPGIVQGALAQTDVLLSGTATRRGVVGR